MKFITTAIAALAAIAATAQEAPDTIATINRAGELTVARTPGGLTVTVEGRADDPDFFYQYRMQAEQQPDSTINLNLPFLGPTGTQPERKRKSYFDVDIEAYVGTSIPTGSTPEQASSEIGLSRVLTGSVNFGGGFSFNVAAGIGYAQYAVGAGMRFDAERQHLVLVPREEGSRDCSSRLRVLRLHVPLTFTQMLSRKAYITAGAWLNLNTYVSASTDYTIGDVRTQQTFKDLHQRILTTDIVVAAGARGICGVYARYCPQSLFRKGWGPDFKSVSVGLIFNF